jgi:excinuclease ABC subunit B
MYADRVTDSMRGCIDETVRRRAIQEAYNDEHGIVPQTVKKGLRTILESIEEQDYYTVPLAAEDEEEYRAVRDIPKLVKSLRKEMLAAAKELDFEKAAELRDRIRKLEEADLRLKGGPA